MRSNGSCWPDSRAPIDGRGSFPFFPQPRRIAKPLLTILNGVDLRHLQPPGIRATLELQRMRLRRLGRHVAVAIEILRPKRRMTTSTSRKVWTTFCWKFDINPPVTLVEKITLATSLFAWSHNELINTCSFVAISSGPSITFCDVS
jgi:hypothetical protein